MIWQFSEISGFFFFEGFPKKKKTVDQQALIAKIIAALQPQLSTIVDNSIDEFETVTQEKTVTVEKLPTITSTFETFSTQQS